MNYTFCKVQCHPKCPNLLGWYLKIEPKDIATYMDVHLSVTTKIATDCHKDPHNFDGKEYKGMCKDILNPIFLGLKWLNATTDALNKGVILVNSNGGWMNYEEKYVLETVTLDKCKFPSDQTDITEYITIKRWPNGKHWYFVSSTKRFFIPEKTNTLSDALRIAEQYVDKKHIKVDETKEMRLE